MDTSKLKLRIFREIDSLEQDIEIILEYLSNEWEYSVAVKFLDIVEDLTKQISINPRQFPLIHNRLNIRKCVITKHNTYDFENLVNE